MGDASAFKSCQERHRPMCVSIFLTSAIDKDAFERLTEDSRANDLALSLDNPLDDCSFKGAY